MPANTLEDAFRALNVKPVRPDQIDELFVLRPDSPTELLTQHLRLNEHSNLLFVGHRGTGKSSELAYLSSKLTHSFFTVFVPMFEILGSRPLVTHIELLFSVTVRLLQQATDSNIVPSGLLPRIWQVLQPSYKTFKELLFGDQFQSMVDSADVTLQLNFLAGQLETKFGTQAYTQRQVNEKFKDRGQELIAQITEMSILIESAVGKRLLLIIEDLDKYDLETTRELFFHHSHTLTALYPNVIYSFPIYLRYANEYYAIERNFDEMFLLPNFHIRERDGTDDQIGIDAMRQVLHKRVNPALYEIDVLQNAIKLSGGNVNNLIRLCQRATLEAIVSKRGQVSLEHLELARKRFRDDYVVMLRRKQIDMLREIDQGHNKDLTDLTDEMQQLLANGSLLEYKNTIGPWAGVNPIITELLDRA